MNPTAVIQKIAKLLTSEDFELRIAVIKVLGAVGYSSRPVVKALGSCLGESDEKLQVESLKALVTLGAGDAIPAVVPLILRGGVLREQATRVVESVGPRAIPYLKKLYSGADYHGKRAVIATLAKIDGKQSVDFLLSTLPGESFDLQKYLTVQVADALDRMTPAQQSAVFNCITRLTRSKAAGSAPQILASAALLLGHFRGTVLVLRARQALRALADKKYQPEVRRHAMVSFARLTTEVKLRSNEQQFVENMLCDDDWYNVAQHALAIFTELAVPKNRQVQLIAFLKKSPHFSVHIHVFERLEASNSSGVVKEILPFLGDGRFRVRQAAQDALKKMPAAIDSLFGLLVQTNDLEVTRRVNEILRDYAPETQKKYLKLGCERLLSLYEQNDSHYKPFLEFVRYVDPEPLRLMIYERAWNLKAGRKRDRWERIQAYLELLWDHHLINAEGRFLLSVACLRLNSKELAPAARRANLGLKVLRALVYDDVKGLVRRLRADQDLTAEDFYYLGFHFSEEGGELRPFGMAMLKHVAKKFPKAKVTEAAKRKLTLQTELQERAEQEEARKAQRAGRSRAKREAAQAPRPSAPPETKEPEKAAGSKAAAKKSSKAVAKKKVTSRTAKKKSAAKKSSKTKASKTKASKRTSKSKPAKRPAGKKKAGGTKGKKKASGRSKAAASGSGRTKKSAKKRSA